MSLKNVKSGVRSPIPIEATYGRDEKSMRKVQLAIIHTQDYVHTDIKGRKTATRWIDKYVRSIHSVKFR